MCCQRNWASASSAAGVVYSELSLKLEAKKRKRTETMGVVTYNYATTPMMCNGRWYFQGEFRMENKVLLKGANSMKCSTGADHNA